ncbi:tRNA pseudouridine(38-40) synthase TruA [Sandarakinorhabdus limnophila]|uniref:tRNA pseudouridine(38-40) synthase TruA n=1 Tax=Sandarakinorhabdus limnophila TaxID=210512 RepID=UPI0026F06B30|nr:tRNA pseudouridine(38-40) synthase TruA [Sandarakinorhabdus limnophila]
MTRFRFTVEYDGRPYFGWQRQDHGPSVQAAIEEAILQVTGETVDVHASGRTDAGVHARAMPAHADIEKSLTPFRLMEAINARLKPQPVAFIDCAQAPNWHARFDCTGRRYHYRIINRRAPLSFDAGLAWRVPTPLDTQVMHAAAQRLVGQHDFTTFRSTKCQAKSPLRTLDRLEVTRMGEEVHIFAAARSFLHHQVRSMVGCLKLVGEGKWSSDDLAAALAARDRDALGLNAPPDGLYFIGATYPELSVGFTTD